MVALVPLEPVDYLVIGHVTEDVTSTGTRLGGTAAFSALTARALGLRPGVVTSSAERTSLEALRGIPILKVPAADSTSFENQRTPDGRRQRLCSRAADISLEGLPDVWRRATIAHLAPVAQEVETDAANALSPALLCMTPQGWMRTWNEQGNVAPSVWKASDELLPRAAAVVLSREDVLGDEDAIHAMAQKTRVLAVTNGAEGAVLYWNGDSRRFRAPDVQEVDDTGAGDIFATALFIRLHMTRDPWEAARFATLIASRSVSRPGLEGVPTSAEIQACSTEILNR